MIRYGTMLLTLPTGPLTLNIHNVELRGGHLLFHGVYEVPPGGQITLPAGYWPCVISGPDGVPVFAHRMHITEDHTADGGLFAGATLTVVFPIHVFDNALRAETEARQ